MTRIMRRALVIAIAIGLGSGLYVPAMDQGTNTTGSERIVASSELFAGFLVALEDQRTYWGEKGVTLTPRELTKRNSEIQCYKDGSGVIVITFYSKPLLPGGSVRYYVDPKELKVVKRSSGR